MATGLPCLRPLLALALLTATTPDTGAEPMAGRGTWWWAGGNAPLRVGTAVGDPVLEDRTLAVLLAHDIRWLYESSGALAKSDPARLAAWHRRLAANGVGVQLLLSENTWIQPENRPALLNLVQDRILKFNSGVADPSMRFGGLHLDIEPHALPQWSAADPAGRRQLLQQLADTFATVRQYLDSNGGADLPIQADLPTWYDNLGGSIGWTDAADRDNWFETLAGNLKTLSLMAYERSSVPSIQGSISWEMAHFPGQIRCALEFDIGPGLTWPALDSVFTAAGAIESADGPLIGTDLHSLNSLSAIEPEPALPPWLSWRAWCLFYYGTTDASGVAAPTAAPGGDGMPNLLKYALGGDPRTTTAPPSVSISGGRLAFAFVRMRPATDIVYQVEMSNDLAVWTTVWSSDTHPYPGGMALSSVETVVDPGDAGSRRFARLRIALR